MIFVLVITSLASQITITWWINPWIIAPPGSPAYQPPTREDYPKWPSEAFMALHLNVKIEHVVVGNTEYSQKMASAIATETQPDSSKGPVWDCRGAEAGFLEPIEFQ